MIDDIEENLRSLARRIARTEKLMAAHLEAHSELADRAALLRSIPGIGAVAVAVLVASMPELGSCDRRAAASLGGLAPKARESGKWRGARRIGKGREQVRRALYMAALSLMARGKIFSALIARLRAKGKPGKLIAIALARKLLVIANAVLRDKRPFQIS